MNYAQFCKLVIQICFQRNKKNDYKKSRWNLKNLENLENIIENLEKIIIKHDVCATCAYVNNSLNHGGRGDSLLEIIDISVWVKLS